MNQTPSAPRSRRVLVADILTVGILRALASQAARREPANVDHRDRPSVIQRDAATRDRAAGE